ncbi:hypothetical protein K2W90_02955 [Candidatus Babeliales bacterium]|nr:hypothetical protein [Candidatus Babeliales bacterium]
MTYFRIFMLSMVTALCVGNAQPATTFVPALSTCIELPRMRLSSIKRKQELFAKRIERTKKRGRVASFAGGAVVAASTLYLGYELWCYFVPEKEVAHDQDVKNPAQSAAEKSEYERLKQERLREWEERRSFLGRVKHSVKDGASFAFYSFIVGMIWHMFNNAQEFSLANLKQFFQEDEVWFFKGIDRDIVANIERLGLSLSRFMNDMNAWFKDQADDQETFKPYFCHDVTTDFAALIDEIENLLALVCVSAQERLEHGDDLGIVLDQQNSALVDCVEIFAQFIEQLLNDPVQDFQAQRRRMHLVLQQCSVGIIDSLRVYSRLLYAEQ